jgi:hypothetical protein
VYELRKAWSLHAIPTGCQKNDGKGFRKHKNGKMGEMGEAGGSEKFGIKCGYAWPYLCDIVQGFPYPRSVTVYNKDP